MDVEIYTDGGCSGNPGPGGWAYVITGEKKLIREEWGGERDTTNNRMELMAVISALEKLPYLDLAMEKITLYTDSQYVQKGITQWIHSWKRNNWRTAGKEPVKNRELWQRLDVLSSGLPLNWVWVKGHAGNPLNERCDALTQKAIKSLSGSSFCIRPLVSP
ncbi:MAG: ribonuclease HI [Treponema sp.]|nr:ribonuclease HI [Treponema sp.]